MEAAGGVAQLTGLDATRIIGMIVQAANRARLHKRNCRQFAQHLELIGNLLQQPVISQLKNYPEKRELLEKLEDALRRAYVLVNSCRERSYFYLFFMGRYIVNHFRRAQDEIDQYLKLIPLITLGDTARVPTRIEDDCTDSGIPAKVMEYCKKHIKSDDRTTEDDLKAWDAEFVKVDQATLFDLVQAANCLKIQGLLDLTSQTVAEMIKGKTPEEIRKIFNLKNDFTPEEEDYIRSEKQWAFE